MNDEPRASATAQPENATRAASAPRQPAPSSGLRRLMVPALIGVLAVCVFRGSSYRLRFGTGLPNTEPEVRLGREIYLAEGCIHCHSQYVRPGTRDEILWGPPADPARALSAEPPLIGNRRQGPDLMNVGNRRSPEWQRAHLYNPRSLVPGSRMPAFAHLFIKDGVRGEALVAYLVSLGADTGPWRQEQVQRWQPAANSLKSSPATASILYRADCAPCHGKSGMGDGPLASAFGGPAQCRLSGTSTHFGSPQRGGTSPWALARVIKFGLPGTSMPGYETLSDGEVIGLAAYAEALKGAAARRNRAGGGSTPGERTLRPQAWKSPTSDSEK